MPKPYSFSKVDIDVDAGAQPLLERPEPDTPFRILILGDFSGRANRGIFEPIVPSRRAVPVDRDNFDEVMERTAPTLRLPCGEMQFRELDDFRPDRLFEQAELFRALRQMRERLSDRSTFASAAAELAPPPPPPADPPPAPARPFSLDDLVEETETRTSPSRAIDDFSAMVRDLVAPHLAPGADPRQAEMVAKVDAATGEGMRELLHHPEFQALEAAWRGLFFLVRRIETDVNLKIYLLDVSQAELAAELKTADLRKTGMFRILVEQTVGTPGAHPWAVVAGNYIFDESIEDVTLLGFLGGICRVAGAPFLAGASSRVVGCECFGSQPEPESWTPLTGDRGKAWEILRSLPEAQHIGLVLPRFLLRLPYGKATDEVEGFEFEEFPSAPGHSGYLWGNPALACVCLLGQAFAQWGWDMRPDAVLEIEGIPAHIYRKDGESKMKPCAEALLTERAANAIMDRGLMPLLSLKDRDSIRLLRFQSLADPPASLAGRWGE